MAGQCAEEVVDALSLLAERDSTVYRDRAPPPGERRFQSTPGYHYAFAKLVRDDFDVYHRSLGRLARNAGTPMYVVAAGKPGASYHRPGAEPVLLSDTAEAFSMRGLQW